eukprot:NODE_242_length_11906_cov_0.577454.p1 type:complete len:1247 gc:universal NODE_242_length_11906_cov_0.577454:5499-1759(-)
MGIFGGFFETTGNLTDFQDFKQNCKITKSSSIKAYNTSFKHISKQKCIELRLWNGKRHIKWVDENFNISEIFPFWFKKCKILLNGRRVDVNTHIRHLDVLFAAGELKGGSRHKIENLDKSSLKVAYFNVNGFQGSHYGVYKLHRRENVDIVICSETKMNGLRKAPRWCRVASDTIKNNYGMCMTVNPKYGNLDLSDMVISISPYHIKLKLNDNLNILAIYLPASRDVDKMEFFNQKLAKWVDKKTIIIGDWNLNLARAKLSIEYAMMDRLFSLGQVLIDKPPDSTFIKYTKNGIRESNIDHATGNGNVLHFVRDITAVRTELSEHSMIILTLKLDVAIQPREKESKIKSYLLHDRKQEYEEHFENHFDFRNYYNIINQIHPDHDEKRIKDDLNKASLKLVDGIVQSAGKICKYSNVRQAVDFTAEEEEIGEELLKSGFTHTIRRKIKKLKKNRLDNWRNRRCKQNRIEFIKETSNRSSHKFQNKSELKVDKLEDYQEVWQAKWNADDKLEPCRWFIHSHDDPEAQFLFSDMMIQISQLPMGKSAGEDLVTNEMIKYLPASGVRAILDLFNLIIKCGIFPDIFINISIVPIFKRGRKERIDCHRPIALASHLRKLFEGLLLQMLGVELETSDKQYAFKKNSSCLDAAYDLNELIKAHPGWLIVKYDARQAFDTLKRSAILSMILDLNLDTVWKRALWNLVKDQVLKIKLGKYYSSGFATSSGVIQGGKASPGIFAKVLDNALDNWDTSNSHIVVFADDIILLTRSGYRHQVESDLKRRLKSIGLELNNDKTEVIDSDMYKKYLGIALNRKGLCKKTQIKWNLEKAYAKKTNLVRAGIFKYSGIKMELIMKTIQTYLVPILDYSLQIFEPDAKLARRINSFILTTVRDFSGTAGDTKLEDIYDMFAFTDYYTRWCGLHIKWNNHRVGKESNGNTAYVPTMKYSMQPIKQYYQVEEKYRGLIPFIKKQIPRVSVECDNCNGTHEHKSGVLHCFFANMTEEYVSANYGMSNSRDDLIQLNRIIRGNHGLLSDYIVPDKVMVYTDGSKVGKFGWASYVIISDNGVYFESFEVSDLIIDSSTRAEILAICLACNDTRINWELDVMICSDSRGAIETIKNYQENISFRKISSIDIIQQTNPNIKNIELKWVKGHSNCLPNNLADYLCSLQPTQNHPFVLYTNKYTLVLEEYALQDLYMCDGRMTFGRAVKWLDATNKMRDAIRKQLGKMRVFTRKCIAETEAQAERAREGRDN